MAKRRKLRKARRRPVRIERLSAIGQVFPYHDGKVKVAERKKGFYFVRAVTNIHYGNKTIKKGKTFRVGHPWVYKNVRAA